MSKRPLNQQQINFIRYYLVSGKPTQSAIKAGYSERSAHAQACELLKNPKVKAEIDRRNKFTDGWYNWVRKKLLESTVDKAFCDFKDFGRFHSHGYELFDNLDEIDTSALQEVKVVQRGDAMEMTFKLVDKTKYHDMLYKHLGLYNDKLTIQGPAPIVIKDTKGQTKVVMKISDKSEVAEYEDDDETTE